MQILHSIIAHGRSAFLKIVPPATRVRCMRFLADFMYVDPLSLAFERRGILQYKDDVVSGERHLITEVLPHLLRAGNGLILLDVGANVGDYSRSLRGQFPGANILSFEPNPETFAQLQQKTAGLRVQCHNMGMSNQSGSAAIFVNQLERTTGHASLYPEVLQNLHGYDAVDSVEIKLATLDDFCRDQGLERIDFLKIDTEGHELKVLQGASGLLKAEKIDAIQFEFNEMNVISRVFLRDFFELLGKQFDLFRLHSRGLIPLPNYRPVDEVFLFQNILAVHRSLRDRLGAAEALIHVD